ncbi:alpha/beta fold hydrolase [Streptomyces sp. NPDC001389]|uniref:alpha/beta fold hydrolase n=1 Tax=unclassified Streptomyces TaxID=2593676 RepID=UPI0036B0EE79
MGSLHACTTCDGTGLAHHFQGDGEPLVCLPGGAMRASRCLGDLAGPAPGRRLIRLDLRGTGDSAVPAGESTHRADHQVADVETLRLHLDPERMDLLGHSAAGLDITAGQRLGAARPRAGSAPHGTAIEACGRVLAGADRDGRPLPELAAEPARLLPAGVLGVQPGAAHLPRWTTAPASPPASDASRPRGRDGVLAGGLGEGLAGSWRCLTGGLAGCEPAGPAPVRPPGAVGARRPPVSGGRSDRSYPRPAVSASAATAFAQR